MFHVEHCCFIVRNIPIIRWYRPDWLPVCAMPALSSQVWYEWVSGAIRSITSLVDGSWNRVESEYFPIEPFCRRYAFRVRCNRDIWFVFRLPRSLQECSGFPRYNFLAMSDDRSAPKTWFYFLKARRISFGFVSAASNRPISNSSRFRLERHSVFGRKK